MGLADCFVAGCKVAYLMLPLAVLRISGVATADRGAVVANVAAAAPAVSTWRREQGGCKAVTLGKGDHTSSSREDTANSSIVDRKETGADEFEVTMVWDCRSGVRI